jgi:uncharacterized protein (UPF0332 family)
MNPKVEEHLRIANEYLREIEHLIAGGLYRASVGRAYYAMFHAATAAMLAKKLDRSSGHAIIPAFEKAFIKTEMLNKKFLQYFRHAFNASKTDSEGSTFGSSDHREAQRTLLRTKEFIAACKKLCE